MNEANEEQYKELAVEIQRFVDRYKENVSPEFVVKRHKNPSDMRDAFVQIGVMTLNCAGFNAHALSPIDISDAAIGVRDSRGNVSWNHIDFVTQMPPTLKMVETEIMVLPFPMHRLRDIALLVKADRGTKAVKAFVQSYAEFTSELIRIANLSTNETKVAIVEISAALDLLQPGSPLGSPMPARNVPLASGSLTKRPAPGAPQVQYIR